MKVMFSMFSIMLDSLEKSITYDTKAVIATGIYGNMPEIDEIENIILKLKELDLLSKTSTSNIKNLGLCLSSNICSGYYG